MNAIAHPSSLSAGGPKLDNRRVLAGLIDLLIVLAGALVIGFVAGLSGAEYGNAGPALSAVVAAWALYYYFACESGGGQTLGKRVMRIRVVRLDGCPAGMREIAVRTVLRLVDGLFLYLVGLVVMLVTGERRGRLGDLAAGTMIVSTDAARPVLSVAAAPSVAGQRVTLPTPAPEPAEPEAVEPEPVEPEPEEPEAVEAEPVLPEAAEPEAAEPEPQTDAEPVVVNTPETVSAIDLIMEEEPERPA